MQVRRVLLALMTAGLATAVTAVAGQYAHAATAGPAAGGPRGVAHKGTLAPPRPDHVVVVVEENHANSEVIGKVPYMTQLANSGANFTQSYAITHPSQPNYLALYSGSTQGVSGDSCPHTFSAGNLGAQLVAAGDTFAGYSESLPSIGSLACTSGRYARKHSPWVNFTTPDPRVASLPGATNLRFADFPTDYSRLPSLSFVIPNLSDDAHDGTVAQADTWLKTNLDGYVRWAATHNSLLVVTFDEDDYSSANRIPTFFSGPMVATGTYAEHITHYSVLRTLEDMYGLPCVGGACSATAITDAWR